MDISSLLSSLSPDDIEKLKATAQQFFGAGADSSAEFSPCAEEKAQENIQEAGFPFDPKLITGVAKMSRMMNENDEKSAFLVALKPLLSDKRKKKADDAVMMLKFFRIINLLQENGR